MKIKLSELKAKIEEIYEEKKMEDGWSAWSALCLWLAQYEHGHVNRENNTGLFDSFIKKITDKLAQAVSANLEIVLQRNVIEAVRCNIKPGDYFVLKVKKHLSAEAFKHLNISLKDLFPENKILILEEGMDFSVVEKEGAG